VITAHFFPKQSMNTPESTEEKHFWFDTTTGDQVWPWQFISEAGLPQMKALAADRMGETMKKRHADIVKKYPQKELASAMPKLDENVSSMRKRITDPSRFPFDYNVAGKNFSFYAGWEVDEESDNGGLNAELNNAMQVILGAADIKPFASQGWSYYIVRSSNTPPTHDPISHTWSGMIGGKIPVTFMISNHPASTAITGLEVYDKHGGTLILKGGLKGTSYSFDEIDETGKKTGSFEFTSANGKLTGTWKNGDGTKSMDFKAVIGGAE